LVKCRRIAVNFPSVLNWSNVVRVKGLTEHVEHVTEYRVSYRHGDTATSLANYGATNETVRGLHADAAHSPVTYLLCDFGHDCDGLAVEVEVHLHGVVDLGQRVGWELYVNHRSRNGDDPSSF
jgi:hypothetical protein